MEDKHWEDEEEEECLPTRMDPPPPKMEEEDLLGDHHGEGMGLHPLVPKRFFNLSV